MQFIALFWATIALGLVGLVFALYWAKRGGGPLEYVRIVMCFLFLLASAVPFLPMFAEFLYEGRIPFRARADSLSSFGLATLLGAFAVTTLFIGRRAHFVAGVLFFGHYAGMVFMDLTTKIYIIVTNITDGMEVFRPERTGHYLTEYGFRLFVLALAVAGIFVEVVCERRAADQA